MKKLVYFISANLFSILILMSSCQKEDNEVYEVNFSIGKVIESSNAGLKCTPDYNLEKASHIVITIKNSNGNATAYTSSEIGIYKLNGQFYSQKILLKPGSYKLTEFLIADSSGFILFTIPCSGSTLETTTNTPLPLAFTVTKDNSTLVPLVVISTEGKTCNDFGLVWFPVNENLVVRLGVVDMETGQFIAADLSVTAGTYTKTFALKAIANNIVSVPTDYETYSFTISKTGYMPYQGEVSIDSLRILAEYSSYEPALVELTKINNLPSEGLILYYPFNGNANDESGNGYNATVYGPLPGSDRFGNPNKAYVFDGINDYIQLPLKLGGYKEFTAVCWFKAVGCGNSPWGGGRILSHDGYYANASFTIIYRCPQKRLYTNLELDYYENYFYLFSPENTMEINQWYQAVLIYSNKAHIYKIYVNGLLAGSMDVYGNQMNIPEYNARIGCRQDSNVENFQGTIDDIRVYNRALSDEEIMQLYMATE